MNRNRGQFGYGSVQEYHDDPVRPYRDSPDNARPQATSETFVNVVDSITSKIFTINSNAITLDRVLKQLGTGKDSADVRKKVHETEERTNQVITETAGLFKKLQALHTKTDRTQRLQMDRLMGEFKDTTQKYHDLQTKVADRAKFFAPPSGSMHAPRTANLIDLNEAEKNDSYESEQRRRQAQIERETVETEVALLQERDVQIRQLESDILDINEIFRDLGTMVHEQGVTIDSIESNVESAQTDVEQGVQEVGRASLYQSKARKKKCCLIVTVLIVIAIVVIIIVVSVTTHH